MATWELFGAAVGAGLASGREIASFFGRYGAWGYAGIVVSAAVMALLAGARLPSAWRGRWPERLWRTLQSLLLLVTGGAMLAGAVELATALPGRWARPSAMAATLLTAWLLAYRTQCGLAWVSRVLLAGLAALLVRAMLRPPMGGTMQAEPFAPLGLLRAAAYGGFNAAIMHPVMAVHRGGARPLTAACSLLACLLAAGLAVLLRHPAAMGAPMPFAFLAGEMGGGQLLAGACLYMAILSTLTACLRGLGSAWSPVGVAVAAMLGFTGAVESAYPLLGGACAVMMAAMRASNFAKSERNTFLSGRGVV